MTPLLKGQHQDLHEGDMLVRDVHDSHDVLDVHTVDHEPLTVPEEWTREHGSTPHEPRRPVRWMRWLASFGVLVLGAGTAFVIMRGGDDTAADQQQPVSRPIVRTVDRWELGLNPPVMPVVLRTVDNWELGLNPPSVLVMPQAMSPVLAPEGDWDHLMLNPVAPQAPVVSIEHDWDHLLLSVSDGSFEVAEANRMLALNDLATGFVSDGSFEVAETNRMLALKGPAVVVSIEHDWDHLLVSVSDGSFEVAEANRMLALNDPTTD